MKILHCRVKVIYLVKSECFEHFFKFRLRHKRQNFMNVQYESDALSCCHGDIINEYLLQK